MNCDPVPWQPSAMATILTVDDSLCAVAAQPDGRTVVSLSLDKDQAENLAAAAGEAGMTLAAYFNEKLQLAFMNGWMY